MYPWCSRFGSRKPQRLSRTRVCAIIGDELRMFGPDLDELTPHTYRGRSPRVRNSAAV
jgi:hypothetical protein